MFGQASYVIASSVSRERIIIAGNDISFVTFFLHNVKAEYFLSALASFLKITLPFCVFQHEMAIYSLSLYLLSDRSVH